MKVIMTFDLIELFYTTNADNHTETYAHKISNFLLLTVLKVCFTLQSFHEKKHFECYALFFLVCSIMQVI